MQYLEYVQPTGNRQTYTTTGLLIDDINFRFVFDYLYYEQPSVPGTDWSELIGTGYPNKFRLGSQSQSTISTSNIYTMIGSTQSNVLYNYTIDGQVEFNKNGLYVDGIEVLTNSVKGSQVSSGYLTIGADTDYPTDALVNSAIKIGRLKVYDENNDLVGDFVPAEDNGEVGFYDEVGQTFYTSDGVSPWIAGPALPSIVINPTSSSVKATGGTVEVAISTENSWVANPTDGSWYSLSETGGTGDTAITITVPSYTGATARQDTITFVDTNTTDEMVFTLKQKKYQSGQPMYLGGDEITEFYLGGDPISEMYLGETLVFSSGPFQGLKVTPKTINFAPSVLTATLKIKSSEAWTATTPVWITASPSTGETGETTVTLTATAQTADTTGVTVITSASYSASIFNNYKQINYVSYIHSQAEYADSPNYMIDTGIIPDTSTYGIVEGQFRGKRTPYCLVGYWTIDSNDWRFFKVVAEPGDNNNNSYMDVGNRRVNNVNVWLPTIGDNFEMEFGNLYIKNRLTDVTVTGTPYTGNLTGESIKLNTNPMWISRLRLYTQNNLVFDGKAAEVGGKYGLYDEVSETLFSSDNFTIVGETTN